VDRVPLPLKSVTESHESQFTKTDEICNPQFEIRNSLDLCASPYS